ncbi:Transcriptional regulator SlyA [Arenibacter antarcticus]|uniref:MarR family winged helix-turn-helix transcriptional regulator n=1 Tax=Arenibacter antarcticus TaxID=2040469 RepID=A0ABW5VGY0_9FLAO|nr:helix-turn-helix domain-containing protein [Arenibacter sp. H213]MCM4168564.1 MarR family transcriptional regulator [Arenibacter sp. H213]
MKDKSVFNPDYQNSDISSKIVAGLSRISEAFKVLLWEKAKLLGLSPIQIQILIFIAYHKPNDSNVSYLAKEFNLTKPTISDAIKVLHQKGMITKNYSLTDSRSYSIELSDTGIKLVAETDDFAFPLKNGLKDIDEASLQQLFGTLSNLIYHLNQNGVLTVQRTCYGCKFYSKHQEKDYCNLLKTELLNTDIRLDCPEYEEKNRI